MKPSERAASTWPLARADVAVARRPRGTSANSAGWHDRDAEAEQRDRARARPRESTPAAIPAAIAACANETPTSSARFSKRSTIAPATPAPSTTGPQSAKNSAETANAEPVRCCTCRTSGMNARKSPSAESAGGAGEQAEVAGTWRRCSRATARAPLGARE